MQYLPYGTEVELLHPNGSTYDAVVTGIAAILEKVSCMIARLPTLYKLDTRGDIRIWFVERNIGSARYRVCSGLEEGKIITGDWMVCEGKNIGRPNETSPEAQCYKQIESEYDHKLKRGYYKNRAYAANRKPLPKWATICYQNETPDGIPRFGIAKAFYDEKRDL